MKGSEKQLAWATEIQEEVVKIFDNAIAFINQQPDDPRKSKIIADMETRKELVINAEYAGDIITIFQGIRYTGDSLVDFPKVRAKYSFKGNTPSERKLLCQEEK